MFVSFRKCSPPQKPDPISDRNCQNLYPISDQNGSKTIPFGAAHTYIPYIGEYPPPGLLTFVCGVGSSEDKGNKFQNILTFIFLGVRGVS